MSRKHDSAPVLAIKEISWHLLGLFVVDDLYVGWFFRFLLMFAGAQRTEKILGWLRFSSFFLSLSLSLSLSLLLYTSRLLPLSPTLFFSFCFPLFRSLYGNLSILIERWISPTFSSEIEDHRIYYILTLLKEMNWEERMSYEFYDQNGLDIVSKFSMMSSTNT